MDVEKIVADDASNGKAASKSLRHKDVNKENINDLHTKWHLGIARSYIHSYVAHEEEGFLSSNDQQESVGLKRRRITLFTKSFPEEMRVVGIVEKGLAVVRNAADASFMLLNQYRAHEILRYETMTEEYFLPISRLDSPIVLDTSLFLQKLRNGNDSDEVLGNLCRKALLTPSNRKYFQANGFELKLQGANIVLTGVSYLVEKHIVDELSELFQLILSQKEMQTASNSLCKVERFANKNSAMLRTTRAQAHILNLVRKESDAFQQKKQFSNRKSVDVVFRQLTQRLLIDASGTLPSIKSLCCAHQLPLLANLPPPKALL